MTYRSLMVYLELEQSNESALRVACELAAEFKSQVIGVAAGLPNVPAHADGMIGTSVLEADYEQLKESISRCESQFQKAMTALDHPLQWRSDVSYPADFLAAQARAADLLVVSRPSGVSAALLDRSLDIGDVVLRAGRPVLVIPPGRTSLALNRVLVAWKDTSEARRVISASLPLLRHAKDVMIVEVVADHNDREAAAKRAADVANWLSGHGVAASASAELSAGNDGSHLDLLAAQTKADVIVAGAYGHSRLREWAFGGVTRHLLQHASACALLMH